MKGIRTLVVAVILAVGPQGAGAGWLQEEIPDVDASVLRYGDSLTSLDLSAAGWIWPDYIYRGDHDSVDGPYRVWSYMGRVMEATPPEGGMMTNLWMHYTRGHSTSESDVFRVWVQQGTDPAVLAATVASDIGSYQSFVCEARPVNRESVETPSGFLSQGGTLFAGTGEAIQYGADLSGVNLAEVGALVPRFLVDQETDPAQIWRDFGQVLDVDPALDYTGLSPAEMIALGACSYSRYYTTNRDDPVMVWTERSGADPVLATIVQPTVGYEDYFQVEVRVRVMPNMTPINPYPARLAHGSGTATYDVTGSFGVMGLPAGANLADNYVDIEGLLLDGGFATLKMFWDQLAVDLAGLDEESIRIYWYDADASEWLLAGNEANDTKNLLAQFVSGLPTDVLGDWGVDTKGHYAWANIDHASIYGAAGVPEPATLGLLLLGFMSLVCKRRGAGYSNPGGGEKTRAHPRP